MLLAALLLTTQIPSTGERINKMCFIHTKDYYSEIKKLTTQIHATTQRNIILNKKSQRPPFRLSFYVADSSSVFPT